MSSFPILDLVAGILFVYFILSIICSSAVEIALAMLRVRSKVLTAWLMRIFDKDIDTTDGRKPLGQAIMDHCTITALSTSKNAPSYMDARNFVSALLEKLSFDPARPTVVATSLNEFIASIEASNGLSTELKRVILTYANEAKSTYAALTVKTGSEIDLFRQKLENWYDTSMDRVIGTLKSKYARPFTFLVACVTVVLMNADSIEIAKYLYNNPEAAAQLANQAYDAPLADSIQQRLERLARQVPDTGRLNEAQIKTIAQSRVNLIREANETLAGTIPLGWGIASFQPAPGSNIVFLLIGKLIGLAATVLAIMMGAPFWFDVLNKVANLRSSGNKPRRADEQAA